MSILVATSPARSGTVNTGAPVQATDEIPLALLGKRGALLEIINGNAAPDTVGISDASTTTTGAAATPVSKAVANGTSQIFKIVPQQADPATKKVTVTHSVTATVSYKLYSLG